MKFTIRDSEINASILSIMTKLQEETGKPKAIKEKDNNVLISCPFHKDGLESNPSCSINADEYNESVAAGVFQCWSCKAKGNITKIVAQCKRVSYKDAEDWILSSFPNSTSDDIYVFDKLEIPCYNITDGVDLSKYEPLNEHAYEYLLNKRRLKKSVVDYFGLLYDREHDAVVFPVKDECGKTVTTTQRCISNKTFYNMKDAEKPVYLLDEAVKYDIVYVCESQINALTLWGWNRPAVALIGTGSQEQYDILNRSGIKKFVLCFDGDSAGWNGMKKFKRNVKGLILTVNIPKGKDVNDMTLEEFTSLKCY